MRVCRHVRTMCVPTCPPIRTTASSAERSVSPGTSRWVSLFFSWARSACHHACYVCILCFCFCCCFFFYVCILCFCCFFFYVCILCSCFCCCSFLLTLFIPMQNQNSQNMWGCTELLVEFTYLVFTHMLGDNYCRRLRSLCDVFWWLINSLVGWFFTNHVVNAESY